MKKMIGLKRTRLCLLFLAAVLPFASHAQDAPVETKLERCLKRADALPDIAAVEAGAWIKNNGGNDAHLCRAFAQANRGMHEDSAREFWFLASWYDKHDTTRAVLMHTMSGQEFLRGKDMKNAEAQYAAALKIAPNDAVGLIGRAQTRMETEQYWDALDDLNRVLKNDPDNAQALRQRGRAWMQLGNSKNAQEDFAHVEALSPSPSPPQK